MTETEWYHRNRPIALLEFAFLTASERKLRLFTVFCNRRLGPWIKNWHGSGLAAQMTDALDEYAEGHAAWTAVETARAAFEPFYPDDDDSIENDIFECVLGSGQHDPLDAAAAATGTARVIASIAAFGWEPGTSDWSGEHLAGSAAREDAENQLQCHILRDLFGNPFRPVAFDPAWRTADVLALARGIYDSRDFSAMPILADALQDAGCDSDDILSHCRDPFPYRPLSLAARDERAVHVRGCWVIDLLLGKA